MADPSICPALQIVDEDDGFLLLGSFIATDIPENDLPRCAKDDIMHRCVQQGHAWHLEN